MDQIIAQRQEKDRFFKSSPYSPLTPEQQAHFTQLNYYDPNPALVFDLTPELFPDRANVKMQTSTGDTRYYKRWGRIKFQVEAQEAELTLYYNPGDSSFFVPFMDATSGTETYGAGRYVEVERRLDGRIHIDFNEAYSPYCAYNEPLQMAAAAGREPQTWSCPIPPKENRLNVPIRAGEKKPTGDWVIQEDELHPGDHSPR